jgi:hypothetical protein
MIAHSVTQIAKGTRFRCMFGQIKRREGFSLYHTEAAACPSRIEASPIFRLRAGNMDELRRIEMLTLRCGDRAIDGARADLGAGLQA